MTLAHLAGAGMGPQGWAFRNEADGSAQTTALVLLCHFRPHLALVTPNPVSKIIFPATSQHLRRRRQMSSFSS